MSDNNKNSETVKSALYKEEIKGRRCIDQGSRKERV